jgi:hypothetical protein
MRIYSGIPAGKEGGRKVGRVASSVAAHDFHRTFDPEEADYFYVPHYGSCFPDFIGNNRIPLWPPPRRPC